MTIMQYASLLVVTATALFGCSNNDKPVVDHPAGSAAAEAATAPAPAAAHLAAVDERALASFRLTSDNVAKATRASENIAQAITNNPQFATTLEQQADHNGDAQNLQDVVDRISSLPPMRTAIEDAGISPRDFVLVMFATMQAGMADAFAKQGQATKIPASIPKGNIDFVSKHGAEIARLEKAIQKMSSDSSDSEEQ